MNDSNYLSVTLFMRITAALLALALVGCNRQNDNLFVDPALLALVPSDTVVLAGIKMEKLRETAAYKKYFVNPQFKQPLDTFEKETGLDPRKDLWEIMITSDAKGKSLVLARGSFSGMGMEPTIEKPGIVRANYKGYMLFTHDDSGVVFLNSSTIAAGKIELLHQLIDARNDHPPAPKAFLDKLGSVRRNNQAWVIALNGLPIPQFLLNGGGEPSNMTRNLMANLPRLLGSLQSSTAMLDLSSGLHLTVNAQCPTPKDSKTLHDTLRGVIGLARLQMPDRSQDMLKLLDAPLITMSDSSVNLDMNFTNEDLETLSSKVFSSEK